MDLARNLASASGAATAAGLIVALIAAPALFGRPGLRARRAAIIACGAAGLAALACELWPIAMLHAAICLAVGARDAATGRRLRRIAAATGTDAFAEDWAQAAMKPARLAAGETLYRGGEAAPCAFLLLTAEAMSPETGVRMGPGALIGEAGLFALESRRLGSGVCVGSGEALRVDYAELERLYARNPRFGLHLTRLMSAPPAPAGASREDAAA